MSILTQGMLQTLVRGSTIDFSLQFLDKDQASFVPNSAILLINYHTGVNTTQEATVPISLSDDGVTWEAHWDSSVAQPGIVNWTVQSTDPSPYIAYDGQFLLAANLSNLGR